MKPEHIEHIRSILDAAYPRWEGTSDPRFVAQEIDYKREAAERAATKLSRSALADLIERERSSEFIERLEEVGKEKHFLYLATPSTGGDQVGAAMLDGRDGDMIAVQSIIWVAGAADVCVPDARAAPLGFSHGPAEQRARVGNDERQAPGLVGWRCERQGLHFDTG